MNSTVFTLYTAKYDDLPIQFGTTKLKTTGTPHQNGLVVQNIATITIFVIQNSCHIRLGLDPRKESNANEGFYRT